MKRIPITLSSTFLSLLFAFLFSSAFGNAAQPGFWSTGSGHSFLPLILSDSSFVGKIRMLKEEINIHLFPGFAVVRGDYWMQNKGDSTIRMTVGYPVNGETRHPDIDYVMFDDLYQLQVWVNGNAVRTVTRELNDSAFVSAQEHINVGENWYTWKMAFGTDSLTHIRVYFIVNTNDANLSKGYGKAAGNGFAYILESGKAWAETIGEGQIRLEMKGGLTGNDIQGILPAGSFSWDGEKKFIRSFEELEPEPSSNVVVRYHKRIEGFDFDSISRDFEKLYADIDAMASQDWESSKYAAFKPADFEVPGLGEQLGNFVGKIVWIVTGCLAALAVVIFIFFRLRKRKA